MRGAGDDHRGGVVLVPHAQAAELVGPLPASVRLVPFDPDTLLGTDDPAGRLPVPPAEVRVLVPPFLDAAVTERLAAGLPHLELVQTLSAGVDAFVGRLPAGVTLCDARGVNDVSTSEWVLTALLADAHDLAAFVRAQTEQRWAFQGTGVLWHRTVLIVGYGSIGAAVERRLAGFDVTVLRAARTARAEPEVHGTGDLPTLLPLADAIVLLVPITVETRGLVDAAFLARMKDGALLVNAARGPVVDTGALLAELQSGRLRAALDVTDPEPLPPGHPLWSAPGVLLTPHVAGSTTAFLPRAYGHVGEQVRRWAAGRPLDNVVGAEGY